MGLSSFVYNVATRRRWVVTDSIMLSEITLSTVIQHDQCMPIDDGKSGDAFVGREKLTKSHNELKIFCCDLPNFGSTLHKKTEKDYLFCHLPFPFSHTGNFKLAFPQLIYLSSHVNSKRWQGWLRADRQSLPGRMHTGCKSLIVDRGRFLEAHRFKVERCRLLCHSFELQCSSSEIIKKNTFFLTKISCHLFANNLF